LIYTAVKATVLTAVAVSSAVLASITVIEIVEASKEIIEITTNTANAIIVKESGVAATTEGAKAVDLATATEKTQTMHTDPAN
jgi:hypothetical protein